MEVGLLAVGNLVAQAPRDAGAAVFQECRVELAGVVNKGLPILGGYGNHDSVDVDQGALLL